MTDTPIFITLSFILFGIFTFAFLYEANTTTITFHSFSSFQFAPADICNYTASVNATSTSVGTVLQSVGLALQGVAPSAWGCSVQTFLYWFILPMRMVVWLLQSVFSFIANIWTVLSVAVFSFSKLPILFNFLFVLPLSLIWVYMVLRLIRGV